MTNTHSPRPSAAFILCLAIGTLGILAAPWVLRAQTATGSIIGTVTDPGGAVVPDATVVVTSLATGSSQTFVTTQTGTYSAISLQPGNYSILFRAKGFADGQLKTTIKVGQTANGDFTLTLKAGSTSIIVEYQPAQVDTVQVVVQDVTTTEQIDTIPLNGRNFLDLAQLNPGVQIQDGGNFDPTKNGFTAISMQGRWGRATPIELDGIDVSDQAVGTTTINISEDSIQEFQVAQSTFDPATTLTTTGAVNVITRSGGNTAHGSYFNYFRNSDYAAKIGQTAAPFDRRQYGFRLGGPFKKDRLFWFANMERTVQNGAIFTAPPPPFSAFSGSFGVPFHETDLAGRLDWNVARNWRTFYSIHYMQANLVTGFGATKLQPFANINQNAVHTAGLDGTTGKFTHSFRFGYVRFRNHIADGRSQVANLPAPFPRGQVASINIGPDTGCFGGVDVICLGPASSAPQHTLERNAEYRYDGSYLVRSHALRYGVEYLHEPTLAWAALQGLGPAMVSNNSATEIAFANSHNTFGGGASNPLNYPLEVVVFSNGLGALSSMPGLGEPFGAFPLGRFAFYLGDYWKIRPNLSLNLALRYDRDLGRTSGDLPGVSALAPLDPELARKVRQPDLNLAPQLGIAWDPFKNGRTSLRAGIGLFYENLIGQSFVIDRLLRVPGGFGAVTFPTSGGPLPGTNIDTTPFFGQPIGSVVDQVVAAQTAFQAASQQALKNYNPNVGPQAFADPTQFDFNTIGGLLDPNYRTPRSTTISVGVQRQIRNTLFVEADFIRNTNTHGLINHDANLVGAAKTLNPAAAQAAIGATLAACGVSTIDQSMAGCPNFNGRPATILDYAVNGLGAPNNGLNGQFVPPNIGFAFAGLNSNFGAIGVVSSQARSIYNALQIRVRQNVANPFRGARQLFWVANYNLSRLNAMAGDQDNGNGAFATDNVDVTRYYGPNALDRTSMFSFSSSVELPGGLRVSMLARINSPLAATLRLPAACNCPAEIFLTDLTGDGSGGDVLPGTNLGAFGRSVNVGNLNTVISNFNSNVAGRFTPAAQALVSANLFSPAQLKALGATIPTIPLAPQGQASLDIFVADDMRVSWLFHLQHLFHRLPESLVVEPTVDIFNVANRTNFDPPQSPLRGILDGSVGSANGTTQRQRVNRYGLGSGVFSQGLPRSFQFGVRITF